MFKVFWRIGLLSLQVLDGVDRTWLALDGVITKAPMGGGKRHDIKLAGATLVELMASRPRGYARQASGALPGQEE